MSNLKIFVATLILLGSVLFSVETEAAAQDCRNIFKGSKIPTRGLSYVEQPYIAVTKDGNWLCAFTTAPDGENFSNQHIVSVISTDKGKSWSEPVDIEPSVNDPKTSWSSLLVVPSGRVYVFYNVAGVDVDIANWEAAKSTAGTYNFKYSDDHGRTWSKKRYQVPIRRTRVDREVAPEAKIPEDLMWGWCVDAPDIAHGSAFFIFNKFSNFRMWKYVESEGWFIRSDNILTENDPEKIRWTTYPEGEEGIYSPELRRPGHPRLGKGGGIQTEFHSVGLSTPGHFYCVNRTEKGLIGSSYTRDGGRTWTTPVPATYADGLRMIKNPRACPTLWKDSKGRYLLWYHNHNGATDIDGYVSSDFPCRNPVWVSGGIEKDGKIHWSEPELILYEHYEELGPLRGIRRIGMSYPDFIEQDGRYWVAHANKVFAGINEISASLLEGLWNQGKVKTVARQGTILELSAGQIAQGKAAMPKLPDLGDGGFTVDLWVKADDLKAGQVLLDSRDANGRGIAVTTADRESLRLDLSDGKNSSSWDCDPHLLKYGTLQHFVFIVDGQSKIITVVVDGKLCDGGTRRRLGWGRLLKGSIRDSSSPVEPSTKGFTQWWGSKDKEIRNVNGAAELKLSSSLKSVRLYDRYLRTSEAVGNFNARPVVQPKGGYAFPNQGEIAVFTVTTCDQANQPMTYQWYEGVSPDTSRPVAGATTDTLTITSVIGADAGRQFYCKVNGRDTLSAPIVLKKLSAHWKLDEIVNGNTVEDSSRSGFDGVNHNSTVVTEGVVDGAFKFVDPIAGDVATTAVETCFIDLRNHIDTFKKLQQGTFMAWVKTFAVDDGSPELIIHCCGNPGDGTDGGLIIWKDGKLTWRARSLWALVNQKRIHGNRLSVVYPKDGQWHHVGVTVDADGNGKLYLDGTVVDSNTDVPFFAQMHNTAWVSLTMGAVAQKNYSAYNWRLDGNMDDIRLYNYAFTTDEMMAAYKQTNRFVNQK